MKKIMQVLVYGICGLIILKIGLGSYEEIYEPGMGLWSSFLTIISATLITSMALLALSWALLSNKRLRDWLLPKPKYKLVNNYTVPCILILILTISNSLDSTVISMQSKDLGFLSKDEFSDAKRNKIFNKDEYSAFLVKKEVEDARIAAEKAIEKTRIDAENAVNSALLAKKEKEDKAKCLEDAHCYYTNNINSEYACAKAIPKAAKYKFEWTDSWSESKFDRAGWYDKSRHIVRIIGDKATAQNGFGATQNITYYCDFNADSGDIINFGFL